MYLVALGMCVKIPSHLESRYSKWEIFRFGGAVSSLETREKNLCSKHYGTIAVLGLS